MQGGNLKHPQMSIKIHKRGYIHIVDYYRSVAASMTYTRNNRGEVHIA